LLSSTASFTDAHGIEQILAFEARKWNPSHAMGLLNGEHELPPIEDVRKTSGLRQDGAFVTMVRYALHSLWNSFTVSMSSGHTD